MQILDGKYMRLKNVVIGYTFPKTWSKRSAWKSLECM